MDLGLRDKVALVTAASKGLGRAAAMELAREGAAVAIAARTAAGVEAAAAEIRAATGARGLAVTAIYGRIDVLVNNAGGPPPGRFSEVSDEDWLHAAELTLLSAVRLTRLVLPGMRARRWGRIVNITSISVKQPIATLVLSNALRSGVVAMAKPLAGEVAAEGVTVNNVCPGYFLTDRVRNLAQHTAQAEGRAVSEVLAAQEAAVPMQRIGRPEELAAMIAFLASERAAYITGATIQVDGGQYGGLL
jgi:3-oxoacyl-[acyl-carrier protein] reductase